MTTSAPLRVLVAGGVFRLGPQDRAALQPTPETLLVEGLRKLGVDVRTEPLERVWRIAAARSHDIVHIHHLSKAVVVAALSPAVRRLVFTPHQSGVPARPSERIGLRVAVARSAATICLSEAERAERARAVPRAAGRLCVIQNGVIPQIDLPVRRVRGEDDSARFLYVGQLIPMKRVDLAIRMLTRFPDAVLRLVYHNGALEDDLRQLVVELGLSERVTFVGQRSGQALADQYEWAHALLLPSESESLPSVITEALGTGLPVIASDVGGVRSQVQQAGMLIEPGSLSDLVRAATQLFDDYAMYATTAFARASAVRADYSPTTMAEQHLALYRKIVDS